MSKSATIAVLVLIAFLADTASGAPQHMDRGTAIRLIVTQAARQLNGRHADMDTPDGKISVSAGELLGMADGTSGDVSQLQDGKYVLSGCRPQSCAEKAVVIFSAEPANVYAIGFRHYHCRYTVPTEAEYAGMRPKDRGEVSFKCDRSPSLSVYILRSFAQPLDTERERRYLAAIRDWYGSEHDSSEDVHVISTP